MKSPTFFYLIWQILQMQDWGWFQRGWWGKAAAALEAFEAERYYDVGDDDDEEEQTYNSDDAELPL